MALARQFEKGDIIVKLPKMSKMPKVKVFCLFKMIRFQNIRSFINIKNNNSPDKEFI